MLKKLHVQNYRCLKDVTITFEPLTVLVGANGTGKSTLLNALRTDSGRNKVILEADIWQHRSDLAFHVSMEFDDRKVFNFDCGPRTGFKSPLDVQLLQLDVSFLRQPNVLSEQRRLDEHGANLANAFATLPRPTQTEIAKEFAALVPSLTDVYVKPLQQGEHRLVFKDRWRDDLWYEPSEVSDGTMLVLTFLVLRHQSPLPSLLAIEEPERGLHPYLLGQIVSLLRKIARGELGGKPVQVVLATHSAELLDHVQPEEVRFLSRSKEDGGVVVETAPINTPNWKATFREYDGSLGGMWLSGGLGGVPGN
jgi:predicted ATPase